MDSSFNLLISVIIISFIVTIGFFEINNFITNRNIQVLMKDCEDIINTLHYLTDSNSLGSFTQVNLKLPSNQSICFNNETNNIELEGGINYEMSTGVDIINYLSISEGGDYIITVCYYCNLTKKYLVVIN